MGHHRHQLGSAAGTAVTGALAASHGTSTPLVAAAGLVVVTAALTLAGWTKTG